MSILKQFRGTRPTVVSQEDGVVDTSGAAAPVVEEAAPVVVETPVVEVAAPVVEEAAPVVVVAAVVEEAAPVVVVEEPEAVVVEAPVVVEEAAPVATEVVVIEPVEQLDVIVDIEDADLIGAEKAEMVSSLEEHIEETLAEVSGTEANAEVLDDQADIMENLANSGDATPGAVQAAVSSAGLLINQLGVDVTDESAEGQPTAVENIVVSQESIANDHVQALVVSMEGIKELAGNLRNAAKDTMTSVVRGLSTLFKNKQEVAKALAEKLKAADIEVRIKAKFGEEKARDFDITPFYDLFVTESNAGVGKLKVDWSDTLATNELVLGSGLDKLIASFEKELKLIDGTDFTQEDAIEKLAADLAKVKADYIAPFKTKLEKFDDLGCSGILPLKVAPNGKYAVDHGTGEFARVGKILDFEIPARYRYVPSSRSSARGRHNDTAGIAVAWTLLAGTYAGVAVAAKAVAMPVIFTGAYAAFAAIFLANAVKTTINLANTPAISFTPADVADAVKYVNEAPALIDKAMANVKKIEEIQEKYELVNAKVREAMKANRSSKVGHDYKLLLLAIAHRPKVISKAIINMVSEEVKYVNFVQKRTYNFLNVFVGGSRAAEAPAQA